MAKTDENSEAHEEPEVEEKDPLAWIKEFELTKEQVEQIERDGHL